MTEHEQKADERVDDLDVPETQSEDVKGGLPAVQKVREAAARPSAAGTGHGGQIEIESWSFGG